MAGDESAVCESWESPRRYPESDLRGPYHGRKRRMGEIRNLYKFFGAVILVAIPIVIKYGADNIAQSLEQGKPIQSAT